ncbi:MAG: DUF3467 domain-containing protein [Planctomycetes bacterium]|nr:DUF3467 domain-containing protein [Planctomycetota bacterium]
MEQQNAGSQSIETISASADQQQQQFQLTIDDATTPVTYSTTVRVWGSAEEINLDFAGPLRPTGPSAGRLKIDQRLILNPWAAKRLALALNQAVARYEQAYGVLELDARKRMINPPSGNR